MRPLVLALLLAGCRHEAPPRVTVEVICSDDSHSLAVSGEVRLDESLCGSGWDAVQLEHGDRVELVRAAAGREIWLARDGARAAVEVRGPGPARQRFAAVTSLEPVQATAPPARATVQITAGGQTREVAVDDLRRRLHVTGATGRAISLCALAEAFGGSAATLEIAGDGSAAVEVPRAGCGDRTLKFSGHGSLRLRGKDGAHLLQNVRRMSL